MNRDNEAANVSNIKTTKVVYPQIYSYTLPDIPKNEGAQKIGYTEREDVDKRIYEQTHTAAMKLRSEKLWHAPAFFADKKTDFKDSDFHKFLIKSSVENRRDLGKEWFYFNGTPERSKQLFDDFRQYGFAALQTGGEKTPYELREEQQCAVDKALEYFHSHPNGEFLWNAKPRFGKTLASYDLAKQLGATKVLIVTNRPAIANSWFDDFETFIDGYYFISTTSSLAERKSLTREQFNAIDGLDKKMITFLSLQDLKGSRYFGGDHDKLSWVADLEWDLLVIDEAHEGVDTSRTGAAFDYIQRSHTLHLSGTPFKALANQKFASDAIFNWTYLDEQKAKQQELKSPEGYGPHTDLPDLCLYTYRISQMISQEVNEGIEIEGESRDYAFDLNEFFATKNQKFVHESDVKEFLRNLSTNSKYPFSTPELRDELRHTFWYVGNRVESVKALEQLLKQDEIFKHYKIILAAGDGRSFEEEEDDFKGNEKSFDKVKKAIAENDKTITLSCGQLTTGVTIKEWSAVLMLTDIKTPSTYMQAAFRAQNPYKFTENGEFKAKKSAYLFDFAPTRVLEIYDNFANGLNQKTVNGEVTEAERKNNIKQLLNFFPVISEDVDGKMVELDAEKVLTFPNALAATEIVQARFMTNLLFNDNIKGVFHFPKEVEEILDKMDVETGKRVKKDDSKLDLDDARKVDAAKKTKITENTGIILGEKIYSANIERIVDGVFESQTPDEALSILPDKVSDLVEPVIAKYKEVYRATNAEIDELREETTAKIKLAVAEYESSEIKDPEALKLSLTSVIERDLVEAKVEQQETKKVETVQKSKEEEVREHLRAFTRTIPMFVMANASHDTITIDNFDEQISDEDFIDLTNITKAEFHKLRDGFDYTDDSGARKRFEGVFHKYKFNASIAEFVAEKNKRANYFDESIDEDIFELIPNQKNNQIFTPKKVVKMMIDGLEKESPVLFQRTDSTFIDLYMKSGMYITEIVKKLFANTRQHYSSDAECLKHILENQVYGLAPTGVLQGITQSYIFGFDDNHDISNKNFKQHDLLPEAKDGTAAKKLTELFGNGGDTMKFDAVVGNPPYQEMMNLNKMSRSIYPQFIESALSVGDSVSLIMPARWMSGEDGPYKETSGLVDKMKSSGIKRFVLYPNSQDLFNGVDIKGGVCYFVLDKRYTGDVHYSLIEHGKEHETRTSFSNKLDSNIIIRYPELTSIVEKIDYSAVGANFKESLASMKTLVSSWNPYGFISDLFVKNNEKVERISENRQKDDDWEVIGLLKGKRVRRFIPQTALKKNYEGAMAYKVLLPRANGSGVFGEVFSTPMLIATDTFLQVGQFDNTNEAESLLKYVKTKFFRAMVGVKKTAVFNYKDAFMFVPQQDFTNNSDIDWTKSTPDIDQQLYKKYGLSQEEIDFIETRVKAME